LESIAHYHKELKFLGDQIDQHESHLPVWILLPSLLVAMVGFAIVWISTRKLQGPTGE
jgi:hypothetical protein